MSSRGRPAEDNTTDVHVRLPKNMVDDLRELAHLNDRHFSQEVRRALRVYLKAERGEEKA